MSSDHNPPESTEKHEPEEAPDPEEDDLSDLDDVLDEFAATKLDSKPAPTSSGPGRPSASTTAAIPPTSGAPLSTGGTAAPGLVPDDDEFARQLQAGMADLLGELESSPEMQKQFEQLVKDLGEASDLAPTQASSSTAVAGSKDATAKPGPSAAEQKKVEDSFQEQIRKTMERMQASGESASAAAQNASEDDFLAQMLKDMEKGGAGLGSDEDFSKMLMGMMEQLTNKEILYEPMKELDGKFPAWLEENKDKTPKADMERYETQRTLVAEILAKFEEKDYSDEKVECREYIVDRMQKVSPYVVLLYWPPELRTKLTRFILQMQAAGSPPPDLVGDMNAANEALEGIDAGCPTQ